LDFIVINTKIFKINEVLIINPRRYAAQTYGNQLQYDTGHNI